MAFTAQNIQDIKRHLCVDANATVLDPLIGSLQDGSTKEQLTKDAITACNTALTAIDTAEANADDIVEGGGARFNYTGHIAIKKQAYRRQVQNLARLICWPMPGEGQITDVLVT